MTHYQRFIRRFNGAIVRRYTATVDNGPVY